MSRLIHTSLHEPKPKPDITGQGKLLITAVQDRKGAFLFNDNRLLQAALFSKKQSRVGAIYLGKVKNVCKNMDACFVEIADKELVYLPTKQCKAPFMVNRSFDGRILEGDELLLQIERDALKTKQAAATTKITLQGRYAVFTTDSCKIGISSKLSKEQKSRVYAVLQENGLIDKDRNYRQIPLYSKQTYPYLEQMPPYSAVIRTEAAILLEQEQGERIFLSELESLEAQFVKLFAKAIHSTCFTCLSAPKTPWEAAISQIPAEEYKEVVTDFSKLYEEMIPFFQEREKTIRLYTDASYPLKSLYSLDTRMTDALSRRIWLKSGAYLVVDVTEALTVFDVNSGKYDVRKVSDEAFYQINLEAAREIALQIRLRNLSGIILIDFINMPDTVKQENLLDNMKELVKTDPVHTTVVDITPLGLMEITRKKVNKTLAEQFKEEE